MLLGIVRDPWHAAVQRVSEGERMYGGLRLGTDIGESDLFKDAFQEGLQLDVICWLPKIPQESNVDEVTHVMHDINRFFHEEEFVQETQVRVVLLSVITLENGFQKTVTEMLEQFLAVLFLLGLVLVRRTRSSPLLGVALDIHDLESVLLEIEATVTLGIGPDTGPDYLHRLDTRKSFRLVKTNAALGLFGFLLDIVAMLNVHNLGLA